MVTGTTRVNRSQLPRCRGTALHPGPQWAAETRRPLWEGDVAPGAEMGGGVGRGRGSQERASWPVHQSVCLPTGHRPLLMREATLDGQVKPLDQINHCIYSNCIVTVPKEPSSNELDIIKILMPSFHS